MKGSKIKKYVLKSIFILIASMIILIAAPEFISNESVKLKDNNIQIPGANSRVLIFAPHNDDEVLGAGELIKKTLEQGGKVKVVLITNGDGFEQAIQLDYLKPFPKQTDYIKFGYVRQNESINALRILGLTKENITFLGYPDGGVSNLWNIYWDKNHPYKSTFTGINKSVYFNSFTKNTAYTGENLVSDISKIIMTYKPTYIVYPHPNDNHPDHWATNAFVKYALTTLSYKPEKEWLYLVHRGDWPTPLLKDTNEKLLPPAKLADEDTKWYMLNLNTNDISEKGRAISSYKTQSKPLGLLLSAFERKNELFGMYPDAVLPSKLHDDGEIYPSKANLVIQDPSDDGAEQKLFKGADITGVHAEISKELKLHIYVKLTSGYDKFVNYKVNLIFMGAGDERRINMEIFRDKLNFIKTSRFSAAFGNQIKWNVKNNTLHFIIPQTVTGTYQHLFLDAEASIKNILIDKTAWRMLDN